MCPIQNDILHNCFHSSRPVCGSHCGLPFLRVCLITQYGPHRHNGYSCIHNLINAGTFNLPFGITIILTTNRKSNMFVRNFLNFERIFPDFFTWCTDICCHSTDYGSCFRTASIEENRNLCLYDPGLFCSNLFQRIPQNLCMIHSNGSNHRKTRMRK